MPNKHHARFGLKVWGLREVQTGYTVYFEVFRGSVTASEHGVTFDLVMRLLSQADLLYRGHHVGLDN